MRRDGRIDANQPEIVKAFRKYGCHVAITSNVGQGFPDIVVSYKGFTALVEIKDGSKPPSARKLTTAEAKFKDEFEGWYAIVESTDDVIKLFAKMNKWYLDGLK